MYVSYRNSIVSCPIKLSRVSALSYAREESHAKKILICECSWRKNIKFWPLDTTNIAKQREFKFGNTTTRNKCTIKKWSTFSPAALAYRKGAKTNKKRMQKSSTTKDSLEKSK